MKLNETLSDTAGLMALNLWAGSIGITPITAWRWRRLGWIQTVNIAGRQYIPAEARARFEARAAAGEFARVHKTPKREGGAA